MSQPPPAFFPAMILRRMHLIMCLPWVGIVFSLVLLLPLGAFSQGDERAVEEAEQALASWTGFDSEPPYSILKLDDLENQRDVVFSDEDFEAITRASEQRRESLRDELAVLRDRQRIAGIERDEASEAREKALEADPEPTSPSPALNQATARLFTANAAFDSLEVITEAVEGLLQIEDYHLSAQDERRDLLTSGDRAERASSVAAIRSMIDRLKARRIFARVEWLREWLSPESHVPHRRLQAAAAYHGAFKAPLHKTGISGDFVRAKIRHGLKAWEIVTANEIAAVAAALTAVETRVAALGPDDIRVPALDERRAILLERQAAVHRAGRSVSFLGSLLSRVTNLTLSNRCNRRVIRIGVAYGTQPSKVIDVLRECVDRHGLVLKDPEPMALFEDFGDSALVFAVYFWVEFNERTNALLVASDLRIMIEKRLAELEIAIPFPQRDLHLVGDKAVTVRLERHSKETTTTTPHIS